MKIPIKEVNYGIACCINDNGKKWKEINIDTSEDETPDKEIENEESNIKELYNDIDNKLRSVKSRNTKEGTIKMEDILSNSLNEDIENSFECENCGEEFELDENELDELEKKDIIKIKCPYCNKYVTLEKEEE
jgi:DNA-directed RNA polymerase subunit RPC12/RpoP